MSYWTHIKGLIEVCVYGNTQPEIEYVLKTVLLHLPRVTGSEGDMNVHVVKECGYNGASSHDEFQNWSNLRVNEFGEHSQYGSFYTQENYFLVLEASLRDRMFDQTKREFMTWLCRLSKRLCVQDIAVKIDDDWNTRLTLFDYKPFEEMYEWRRDSDCWDEYLRWERAPNSGWPLKLYAKYYEDKEIDAELKRREEWLNRLESRR